MAAVKEKTVVVTKYDLSSKDIILEIDDKKLKIVEVSVSIQYHSIEINIYNII